MLKIIYSDPEKHLETLQVAGNFGNWEAVPMSNVQKGSWECTVDLKENALSQKKKLYYKFIDDNGNWFTDDNQSTEIDEHGNINNVLQIDSEISDSESDSKSLIETEGYNADESNANQQNVDSDADESISQTPDFISPSLEMSVNDGFNSNLTGAGHILLLYCRRIISTVVSMLARFFGSFIGK